MTNKLDKGEISCSRLGILIEKHINDTICIYFCRFVISRDLVPVKHQIEYDRLAPRLPSNKLRVVHLRRSKDESLGFSVRGGKSVIGIADGCSISVAHQWNLS